MSLIRLKRYILLLLVVFLASCKTQAQATPCQEQAYAIAQYSVSIKPFLSKMKISDIALEEDNFSDGVVNFRVRNLSAGGDGAGTIGWLSINTKKNAIYDYSVEQANPIELNVPKDKLYSFIHNCTAYSVPEKKTDVKNTNSTSNQIASHKYKAIPLPINSDDITKCAYDMDKKIPFCHQVKSYEISVGSDFLSMARESHSPIGEQEFAWLLPTSQGVVFLSFIAEESGNNWFLVSENSSGVSKYIDFGIGSTFNIDKQMKVTVQTAGKRGKKMKHYQIEQEGSVNQLD